MSEVRGVKWGSIVFAAVVLGLLWVATRGPNQAAAAKPVEAKARVVKAAAKAEQSGRQRRESVDRATRPTSPPAPQEPARGEGVADAGPTTGASVIFLHPDGTGVNYWGAGRLLIAGPDGDLQWDRLPHVAVYKGHIKNALTATSNAGGTIHAYGVKVGNESFGNDNGAPINAADGSPRSVMHEAKRRGLAIGIISTAAVVDAGTGTFLASTRSRKEYPEIARQMLEHAPDVMLGGGEQWFLPKGVKGRHGEEGEREDGRNLIDEARKAGYTVVFTRDELAALPKGTAKVLGLFAPNDTFNDRTEEDLKTSGLPMYAPQAPRYAEMVEAALPILAANSKGFLLVAEEEGTDNFAGDNNASGSLEALRRADEAIGVARAFVAKNPRTLLLVAADSDCGGMQVVGETEADLPSDKPLPSTHENGSPVDGREGTGSLPFVAKPDRAGQRHGFAIAWASPDDVMGAVVARAEGFGADQVRGTIDNTDIYRIIHRTLFGTSIP